MPADLTNAVAVASGAYHNLALKTDGTVVAWGNSTFGQTNLPPGLSNVVAVACGDYHSMALTSGGNVVVWGATNVTHEGGGGGSNSFGISIVPAGLSNVVAIAGGAFHCLALKSDGTMIGWGRNNGGQTNVPAGLTNVVAIAAGSYHNLALRDDGTVAAWGTNSLGQTNVPGGLSNVVAIAAGNYFSLALKADGTVVVWGDHGFLQTNTPAGLSNVTAIAGGGYHSLALIGSGPPVLQIAVSNPALGTNGFGVSVPAQCGRVFRLEFKDSLADADWTTLPLAAGNGGMLTLTDPSVPNSQRFYRVRRW